MKAGFLLVGVLAGDGAAFEQIVVALPGHFGEVPLRLGLHERSLCLAELLAGLRQGGAGLGHLLIEVGCFDFGQQLAGMHTVADIDIAFANVTGGARIDGGFGDGRDAAGQQKLGIARGLHDLRHGDGGQGSPLLAGGGVGGTVAVAARQVSDESDGRCKARQQQQNQRDLPARDVALRRRNVRRPGAGARRLSRWLDKFGMSLRRQKILSYESKRSSKSSSCSSSSMRRS